MIKHAKFPLEKEYLTEIGKTPQFKLAIIGRDPYPNDAENIPFIKREWKLLDGRSAGKFLFNSLLGDDLDLSDSPRKVAFDLLGKGVVLLNASYHFLGTGLKKDIHTSFAVEASKVNLPIIAKSENVIVCNSAIKLLRWAEYLDTRFKIVPHPSKQSRNALNEDAKWDSVWAKGALRKIYSI